MLEHKNLDYVVNFLKSIGVKEITEWSFKGNCYNPEKFTVSANILSILGKDNRNFHLAENDPRNYDYSASIRIKFDKNFIKLRLYEFFDNWRNGEYSYSITHKSYVRGIENLKEGFLRLIECSPNDELKNKFLK